MRSAFLTLMLVALVVLAVVAAVSRQPVGSI